jgi:hypothetical protein
MSSFSHHMHLYINRSSSLTCLEHLRQWELVKIAVNSYFAPGGLAFTFFSFSKSSIPRRWVCPPPVWPRFGVTSFYLLLFEILQVNLYSTSLLFFCCFLTAALWPFLSFLRIKHLIKELLNSVL